MCIMNKISYFFLLVICFCCCKNVSGQRPVDSEKLEFDSTYTTIHVLVALCDNQYQGIVPVPKKIGNGQDPDNNLYWGCGYGIRTFFRQSPEWKEIKRYSPNDIVLQRIIFEHKTHKYYLVADAYDGKEIKQCTKDFLYSCSGQKKDTLHIDSRVIGIEGNSRLLAYIGHDGLMDFSLKNTYTPADDFRRDAIILACISKKYFAPFLQSAKAYPLVWTTGLMCPEAYTLHDAISAYIKGGNPESVRTSAAKAYAKYQKCGENAARRLLVTGF